MYSTFPWHCVTRQFHKFCQLSDLAASDLHKFIANFMKSGCFASKTMKGY